MSAGPEPAPSAVRAAWQNRAVSAAAVGAYLAATAVLVPDVYRRAQLHYIVVITLGYGHLLGAVLRSGPPIRSALRQGAAGRFAERHVVATLRMGAAGAIAAVLLLLGLYGQVLRRMPSVVLVLLAVSLWHTVENDLALPALFARRGSAGPPSRELDFHLRVVGLSALLLAVVAASLGPSGAAALLPEVSPDGSRWTGEASLIVPIRAIAALCGSVLVLLERRSADVYAGLAMILASALLPSDLGPLGWPAFGDVFAATSLYHLISWLLVSAARCVGARRAPGLGTTLVVVHALPLALCAALLLHSDRPWTATHAAAFFSPAAYLFWATLHVIHTFVLRRFAADRPPQSAAT